MHELIYDDDESIVGLWSGVGRNYITDSFVYTSINYSLDSKRAMSKDSALKLHNFVSVHDYRIIENKYDSRNGNFIMFGSALAPGESGCFERIKDSISDANFTSFDKLEKREELVATHQRKGFMIKVNGIWTKNISTVDIGKEINNVGGLSLMQEIASSVIDECGDDERLGYLPGTGTSARISIETCWNGIGSWRM